MIKIYEIDFEVDLVSQNESLSVLACPNKFHYNFSNITEIRLMGKHPYLLLPGTETMAQCILHNLQ